MDGNPELSPEQRQTLDEARERAAKVISAARVASFNAWSIGAFAAISILFGLTSPVALILGVGMGVVAYNEWQGRAGIRRLDPEAARKLGRNQVGFMLLIIAYCVWSLVHALTSAPDPEMAQLQELTGVGNDLVQQLTILVYVAVIGATLIFQGLNARYYFKRVGLIETYLSETPAWVVDLQRSALID